MATKDMFQKDYTFHGSQARQVKQLLAQVDTQTGASMFSSAIELFICGAVIGCYYDKKYIPDKDKSDEFKIFSSQFANHMKDLQAVFKTVILNDSSEIDDLTKLNRAFRNPETDDNYNLLEQYMLGGISILYDKLCISTNNMYSDYLASISKLISEFKDQTETISEDDVDVSAPSTDDIFDV